MSCSDNHHGNIAPALASPQNTFRVFIFRNFIYIICLYPRSIIDGLSSESFFIFVIALDRFNEEKNPIAFIKVLELNYPKSTPKWSSFGVNVPVVPFNMIGKILTGTLNPIVIFYFTWFCVYNENNVCFSC